MSIRFTKYKKLSPGSKNSLTHFKSFLATSCLVLGIGSGAVQAATVTPLMIGARFSSNVGWTPNAPQDGDTIGTFPINRTVFADVTNRQIAFMVRTAGPFAVTAPVYIFNDYSITGGMPVPSNDPIRQTYMNDNVEVKIFTSAASPVLSYSNIYFNGQDVVGSGPGVISPNSGVSLYGDNISSSYQLINYVGDTVPGGAGVLDLVGTPSGTNMTLTCIISNLRDLYIRDKNFASFGFSLSFGRDVVLYDASTIQIASGANIAAGRITGATNSNNHLIMVGNNVVNAQSGQNVGDISIGDAKLLSGTGTLQQSMVFTGDVTLSSGTTLTLNKNLTAGRIAPLATNCILGITPTNPNVTSIVDANIGSSGNMPLDSIIVNSGSAEFKQAVTVSNNIELAPNVSVKFDSNVTGVQLTSAYTGTTVEFANPTTPVVGNIPMGTFAAGNDITNLKVSGSDVTLLQKAGVTNINFTNPALPATLTIAPTQDLAAIPVTTAASGRIHNIATTATQNISGTVGSNTNPLGIFKILSNGAIQINTTNFYSDIYTATNNTGYVEFIQDGAFSYSLGQRSTFLNQIAFNANGEVRGSARASTISVAPAKTARFISRPAVEGYTIIPFIKTTNGFILEGAGSTASFGDLTEVRGSIFTNLANEGKVIFEGSANLRAYIGTKQSPLQNITFAANSLDKIITYTRDIYANTINFNKATINIAMGGTVSGATTLNSPVVNIGQHIWIFSGGVSNFIGSPVFNLYFDNKSNSHITVRGENSVLDLSQVDNLIININDASALPSNLTRVYNFYRVEENGAIIFTPNSKVIVNNNRNNLFVNWSYNEGKLLQAFNLKEGLKNIITAGRGNTSEEYIEAAADIFSNLNDSGNLDFLNFLSNQTSAGNAALAGDAVAILIDALNPSSEIIMDVINNYQSNIINNRINIASSAPAGDNITYNNLGVWLAPFYSHAAQRPKGFAAGYKSNANGASVGVDNLFTDKIIAGIATSFINNKINYKNYKIGDKSNIYSFLLSLYFKNEINNDWYLAGLLSIGFNKIKNSKNRYGESKYSSNSYAAEANLGYYYKVTDFSLLSPTLGARLSRSGAHKYRESNSNISTNKGAYNKAEVILGGNLTSPQKIGDFNFISHFRGLINYDLINKAPKSFITIEQIGASFAPSTSQKPTKIVYNLGTSVIKALDVVELSANYDLRLAKKYLSHQVSIRLKLIL